MGCFFPWQVVSFHLPCPQGRLWCRDKELQGFKADIPCFPQEKAGSSQVDSTERACQSLAGPLFTGPCLRAWKQLSLSQQERSCL